MFQSNAEQHFFFLLRSIEGLNGALFSVIGSVYAVYLIKTTFLDLSGDLGAFLWILEKAPQLVS